MSPPRPGLPELPELWGGIECTVNRVGDRYFDQLERGGHWRRIEDLDLIVALGFKALRYPVLWEKTAPLGPARADWSWPDARLGRLRELGVRPIVGLVHHGSGPRETNLLDGGFLEGLARFARAVAERYPWVEDFTPVNEPLTTARFSGLYGHWYPHGRDDRTFARALIVQCRAIVQAMRAIREVTPSARLIQTEDMGRTYSTPLLAYQAEFENERRWLSLDLLCGRIDPRHPMWPCLLRWGVAEDELRAFLEAPLPPDVVGLNYYITSDRFLDERLDHYPAWSHGGNGRHRYADVHSSGVRPDAILGHRAALALAWERYGLPVALTEVHLGCSREDQLRWLAEAWEAACALREEGADVRAVTVWSLLGAYDWNTVVTQDRGVYEPGAFDLRGSGPRPTALARMARALATTGRHSHPVLASGGWWRRPQRPWPDFAPGLHRDEPGVRAISARPERQAHAAPGPLLIVGSTGTLGRAFSRICTQRGIEHVLLSRREMDIADASMVERALGRHEPWAVINAAGYVRVDDAEADAQRCARENALGPALLAEACHAHGLRLVTFSSDLVFDGTQRRPYLESARTRPLGVYGRTKAWAEDGVLRSLPDALVVRTGAFFGPWDRYNFVTLALNALARGEMFPAADDVVVSPTYVPDLVNACLDLLIDGEGGLWHLANLGELTWAELARQAAVLTGMNAECVLGLPVRTLGLPARRPTYSALASERGLLLPPLSEALERYVAEGEPGREVIGGGRAACAICEGLSDADPGDGRCRLHRERGDGRIAAGG